MEALATLALLAFIVGLSVGEILIQRRRKR